MRNLIRALCCLLLTAMLLPAAAGETLAVSGLSKHYDGCKLFLEEHPAAALRAELAYYYATSELISAFLSKGFDFDVFTMSTDGFDVQRLCRKGYCADLSENAAIVQIVQSLHPSIQRQIMDGGAIYGLPIGCSLSYLAYSPETWVLAGLSEADVPQTFPGLLTFLENWLTRNDADGLISVNNAFDETLYNAGSFTFWLTDMLVNEYVMQAEAAQQPVDFTDPTLPELLLRIEKIGKRLYATDPGPAAEHSLFIMDSGIPALPRMISLRLKDGQPALIHARLTLCLAYAGSSRQELAGDFIETCWRALPAGKKAAMVQHAQPVEDPAYEDNVQYWQEQLEAVRARWDAADEADRRDIAEEIQLLEKAAADLALPESRYLLTEEQLALYSAVGNDLFFQPPSVFAANTEAGQNARDFIQQFAMGIMPAERLLKSLDQLAAMVMLEDQ